MTAQPSDVPGLLSIHAHPDDEVITTGGALARAAAGGRRVKVVTCTDGSRGEVVGAGMDPDEVGPRLAEVRRGELAAALDALGVTEHAWLGYADSGMMGDPGNDDPASFWRAAPDEAIGRLVRLIREFRPQVVTVYDAFGGYGHPDHLQVHRMGLLAVEAAAVPGLHADAGPAWRVPKLYYTTFSRESIARFNQHLLDRGLPSPFGDVTDPELIPVGTPSAQVTTVLDVTDQVAAKQRALMAHASQLGPDSFFLNVPEELADVMYGVEEYVRLRSDVAVPDGIEDDLFAGL